MRKLMLAAALSFCLVGCSWAERRRISMEDNAMSVKFVSLMDKGQTTRDQEQKFIRAAKDNFFQLDRSIRGTSAAEATRQKAEKDAAGADKPLDLTPSGGK